MTAADTRFQDLETKGFVVIPSFLDAGGVAALVADFELGAPPTAYPHGFKLVRRAAVDHVWPRMAAVAEQVRASTSIHVDVVPFLTFSHYIVSELTQRTSHWHQDFDFDFRLTRDHKNYLNFYIPIRKPDVERSNLMVVPLDALEAKSRDGWERLVNGGGHRLIVERGRTAVYGNYGDVLAREGEPPLFTFDADLEAIAVTPRLAAGDLLLLRGDVIHRTQDATTPRTSASIRMTSSRKLIRRDRVGTTDAEARDALARLISSLHARLDALGRDEMTIDEFLAASGKDSAS